jgi:thioredoxin
MTMLQSTGPATATADGLIKDVTTQTFVKDVIEESKRQPVLVDFWAEWCVPCHMVSPVVEEIARDHADRLKAAKLNVDDNPETTKRYAVMSIPTLIVFKDGKEQARVVGARGKDAILREIQPHLAA